MAIDMRQTINDIVQQCILKGRTELHSLLTTTVLRLLYSLGPNINIVTSLFLLGITTVLILAVFRKSFQSIISNFASTVRSDIQVEPRRTSGENAARSNQMKKDRPFGGMSVVVFFPSISLSLLS